MPSSPIVKSKVVWAPGVGDGVGVGVGVGLADREGVGVEVGVGVGVTQLWPVAVQPPSFIPQSLVVLKAHLLLFVQTKYGRCIQPAVVQRVEQTVGGVGVGCDVVRGVQCPVSWLHVPLLHGTEGAAVQSICPSNSMVPPPGCG